MGLVLVTKCILAIKSALVCLLPGVANDFIISLEPISPFTEARYGGSEQQMMVPVPFCCIAARTFPLRAALLLYSDQR